MAAKDSLLAGLIDYLESQYHGVRDVKLSCGNPISTDVISSWERLHHCALPDDLKLFYLSNDGVLLEWSYQYNDAVLQLGRININSLEKMKALHVGEGIIGEGIIGEGRTLPADCPTLMDLDRIRISRDDDWEPSFQGSCKIFSLDHCITCGHICLVYNTDKDADRECSVWLLDLSLTWHYLCSSFSDVFRLAVVHMGLFQWPYALTPYGLSPQYERWLHMFVPKRLEEDMTHVSQQQHFEAADQNTDPSPVHSSQSSTFLNRLDISRVLHSKTLRDKRSKVEPTPAPKKTQFPSHIV